MKSEIKHKPFVCSGSAITRFTQADLSSGLVRYVHTSDTKRTKDQFTFSLTDGSNAVSFHKKNFYHENQINLFYMIF